MSEDWAVTSGATNILTSVTDSMAMALFFILISSACFDLMLTVTHHL